MAIDENALQARQNLDLMPLVPACIAALRRMAVSSAEWSFIPRAAKDGFEPFAVIRLDLTHAFKTSGKARADHRKNQAGIPAFASPSR